MTRSNFEAAATTMQLDKKIVERLLKKYIRLLPAFETTVERSFPSTDLKEAYLQLLRQRIARL